MELPHFADDATSDVWEVPLSSLYVNCHGDISLYDFADRAIEAVKGGTSGQCGIRTKLYRRGEH